MSDRFTRQERLAEVGPAGQARLARARVVVRNDASGAVAAEYLERAGDGSVERSAAASAPDFAHAHVFRHPAARDVGEGAWRALREMLATLERSPS
jgi:hypothetical protein